MPFSIANWTRCLPPMLTLCVRIRWVHVQLPSLAPGFPRCQDHNRPNGHHVGEGPLQADDDGVRRVRLDSRPLDRARGVDGYIASHSIVQKEGSAPLPLRVGEFCRLAVAALHLA